MDETEDQDEKLQKSAPELIHELRKYIPRLVRTSSPAPSASGNVTQHRVKLLVRQSRTDQLLKLLDRFQEWPQLLDPHLDSLLQPLVSAFVHYLRYHLAAYYRRPARQTSSDQMSDLIPVPRAICQILYVFCKVRGVKVITRFFNNEARYLEPMLDAFETWLQPDPSVHGSPAEMVWQERFVMLWWLAHLILVPFDLASIASENPARVQTASPLPIDIPSGTHPFARRLVNLSLLYLCRFGTEQNAAAVLLARLVSRHDMKSTLQESVLGRFLSLLQGTSQHEPTSTSINPLIGLLTFLAKLLASADEDDLCRLIMPISTLMECIDSGTLPVHQLMKSSAVARKLLMKISRLVAFTNSKGPPKHSHREFPIEYGEALADLLNNLAEKLFTHLGDKDTSVRTAASKALSLLAFSIEPDTSETLVSRLVDQTNAETPVNELWTDWAQISLQLQNANADATTKFPKSSRLDFRTADASLWHGLTMTFAQHLLHRSIPGHRTFVVVEKLLTALQFDQISPSGASLGANIRDAACIGFWAYARRYKTAELSQAVLSTPGLEYAPQIQTLANELVVTACLDPAGNVRRAASAGLQELIGRHPNHVKYGITVTQLIDYSAVALRSDAMLKVAVEVAGLDMMYWSALLNGLLGWRGIKSVDDRSRRDAVNAIGLSASSGRHRDRLVMTLTIVLQRLDQPAEIRYEEERHGLLLALTHIVQEIHQALKDKKEISGVPQRALENLWSAFSFLETTGEKAWSTPATRTSKFLIEGTCCMISAILSSCADKNIPTWFLQLLELPAAFLNPITAFIDLCCRDEDATVREAAFDAVSSLFKCIGYIDQSAIIADWTDELDKIGRNSNLERVGLLGAIGTVYRYTGDADDLPPSAHDNVPKSLVGPLARNAGQKTGRTPLQDSIIETLLKELDPETSVERKCTSLKILRFRVLEHEAVVADMTQKIVSCLDDRTIDQRGDIGSKVRIGAIKACAVLLERRLKSEDERQTIIAKLGGLATEKLDKVRWEAWQCLRDHLSASSTYKNNFSPVVDMAQTLSVSYFKQLLSLSSFDWARKSFMEGFITSAAAGGEDLIQHSRMAFVQFTEEVEPEHKNRLQVTVIDIINDNLRNDRLILPAMHFLLFLYEADICQISSTPKGFPFKFFEKLQAAHRGSKNIPKLEVAVKLYAALAQSETLRPMALKKLCSMLTHRFAKIRVAVAESLMLVTEDFMLMTVDWYKSPDELKDEVAELESRLKLRSRDFIRTRV